MESPRIDSRAETVVAPPFSPSYCDFLCYRVDPLFRRLDAATRGKASDEFLAFLKTARPNLQVRPYLVAGFRSDCDFLLWLITKDMAEFQSFTTALLKTQLGKYLIVEYAFLGVTKASPYLPGHLQHFERGPAVDNYLFIYPFTKTHEWYQLPMEKRRDMMKVHNEVGHKYPGVKINTTYTFGLGDYDFMLAFECADPKEFSDLVQRIRETEARPYTTTDIPLIPGLKKTADELVSALAL